MSPLEAAAILAIWASPALYTWIWYKPSQFKDLVAPQDPCKVMALLSNVLKAVQFVLCTYLSDLSVFSKAFESAESLGWAALLLAIALFGQDLNRRVFALLGVDGVYYGVRFGKRIPWVTAYPYSVMPHPQYIGSMCTVVALSSVMPPALTYAWVVYYVYLMVVERKIPGTKSK